MKKFYAVSFFRFFSFLLHYAHKPFFQKVPEKVLQENRKWTFLKCPKWKFSEYFYFSIIVSLAMFLIILG